MRGLWFPLLGPTFLSFEGIFLTGPGNLPGLEINMSLRNLGNSYIIPAIVLAIGMSKFITQHFLKYNFRQLQKVG